MRPPQHYNQFRGQFSWWWGSSSQCWRAFRQKAPSKFERHKKERRASVQLTDGSPGCCCANFTLAQSADGGSSKTHPKPHSLVHSVAGAAQGGCWPARPLSCQVHSIGARSNLLATELNHQNYFCCCTRATLQQILSLMYSSYIILDINRVISSVLSLVLPFSRPSPFKHKNSACFCSIEEPTTTIISRKRTLLVFN